VLMHATGGSNYMCQDPRRKGGEQAGNWWGSMLRLLGKSAPAAGEQVLALDEFGTAHPLEEGGHGEGRRHAVALVDRGECLFEEKAVNAQKAGAGAVIVRNNEVSFCSACALLRERCS
jgi:hypothetical protein